MTSQIIARRIGRIVFGLTLLAGAAWLAASVFAFCQGADFRADHPWLALDAWDVLGWTWLAAIGLGVLAWAFATQLRWRWNPDDLLARSIYLPSAGLVLTLPLTLHMLVALALGSVSASNFNGWCMASGLITGVTHLVLLVLLILRALALVDGKPVQTPNSIYATTVVVSCLPFILIFLIPPLIVAVTGVPFIWIARYQATLIARERALLADAPHVPPRAVVI
jgi:hypothetical protein